MIKKFTILSLILIGMIFSQVELRRQTGTIEGVVFNDVTKEPIPSATVQILGTTIGIATDVDGKFRIPSIPIGTYQVRATALGFEPHTHTDIIVAAGRQVTININLRESLLEFEEVTVTSEYFTKTPDAPISVQTLDAEEIRRSPGGFEDVVRAISILPGVVQAQSGRNDLIVRGGAPSENLYVVDNIELSNINHFGTQGASGGPLSFINLDFVNETSFKTGGFGVKYGDKLSSVLSIDLRDGRTDRLGGKATISSSQFGLNLEGPVNQNGSFLFSARRSYLDFIFKAAGFGFVPEYWDFFGKGSYKLSASDQLVFTTITALDRVKLFNDTEDKRYDNSRLLDNDQNQFAGGVSWRHLFNKGFFTVSMNQTLVDYKFQQNDSLLQPLFKTNSRESETSFRFDMVYQLTKETEFLIGSFGKYIGFQSDILLPSFLTTFGQRVSLNAALDTTAVKSAGYLQLSQALFGRLRAIAGARIDYFNLIKDQLSISPRFALSYSISPVFTINSSIGIYRQAPSYIWLVANQVNRELKYITAHQYIGGIEYLFRSDIKLSVEVYQKYYSDYPASTTRPYLVLANTGAGFGGSEDGFASFGFDPLVSAGSGFSYGVELFAQKKLSEIPFYGLVSISFNQSRFKALDGIERSGSFEQQWILNAGGGYILDEKWEFSSKFRFATGRPYTPFTSNGTQRSSEYNSRRIGSNHSLDLRVDRRWNFNKWNLITYIDLQNIYNRKATDIPRYDERKKETVVDESIGLLPAIGISAEF